LNNYSRNTRLENSNSLKKYFHTNRSQNEAIQFNDNEKLWSGEKSKNELRYSKPNLRKNVYASLPKKTFNERKASSPNNYSVLTDNFVKIEDSLTMKYSSNKNIKAKEDQYTSTSRNTGLNLPKSSYKSSSKVMSKKSSLPMSKSVK